MHEDRWIALMKKAAVEAVEAMKPATVVFGRITGLAPGGAGWTRS